MNHIDKWHDAKKAKSAANAKWKRNNRGGFIIGLSPAQRAIFSAKRSVAARRHIKPTLATVKFVTVTP